LTGLKALAKMEASAKHLPSTYVGHAMAVWQTPIHIEPLAKDGKAYKEFRAYARKRR